MHPLFSETCAGSHLRVFSLCQTKQGFFPRLHAKIKTNKQDIQTPLMIILNLLGSQDSGIRISLVFLENRCRKFEDVSREVQLLSLSSSASSPVSGISSTLGAENHAKNLPFE